MNGSQLPSKQKNHRYSQWLPLFALTIAFVGLAGWYSVTVPLWEAPDETSHFNYVRYLVEQKKLPVSDGNGFAIAWHHPPLYYLLAAIPVSRVDMSAYINWRRPNPKSFIVDPTNPTDGPANVQVHSVQELPPYQDMALAVHLARWVNVLLGAGVVVSAYVLARKIFPQTLWIAVCAASLIAFNPEFLFISAVVNNEIALALTFSLALLPAVNILQGKQNIRQFVLLGFFISLAILTKQSGLALGAVAAFVIAQQSWQLKTWKNLFVWSAWTALPIVFLTAPIYIRNTLLYGDPFGYAEYVSVHPPVRPQALSAVLGNPRFFSRMHETFWGYFGWLNIPFPNDIYTALWLIYPLALLGLLLWLFLWQKNELAPKGGLPVIALLLVTIAVAWVFPIRHTARFGAFGIQGRYLFPMITPQAILIALGFYALLPGKIRPVPVAGLSLGLLFLALWTPIVIIGPEYEYLGDRPEIVADIQHKRADVFGNIIELAGYNTDIDSRNAQMSLTLYWKTLNAPPEDYTIFAQLFNPQDERIGQDDRRPLDGAFPTNLWRSGDVMRTEHSFPLDTTCFDTPCYLILGFYKWETGERISVTQGATFGDAVRIDRIFQK